MTQEETRKDALGGEEGDLEDANVELGASGEQRRTASVLVRHSAIVAPLAPLPALIATLTHPEARSANPEGLSRSRRRRTSGAGLPEVESSTA